MSGAAYMEAIKLALQSFSFHTDPVQGCNQQDYCLMPSAGVQEHEGADDADAALAAAEAEAKEAAQGGPSASAGDSFPCAAVLILKLLCHQPWQQMPL